MIVKFFTNGTGGSKGVFDYLLKDKEQPDGKRLGAEVLRGDIDNQALLIDSLDFKQKYTSGCLSFTESADQVTQAQKEQLMDSFEETIRAGLGVDRVAVSWIEHRDKGRLELNFVYANVDLEHGRAFQPYVHSVDKRRVNAWKDMQNIEYGFSDPNDPANKRLMGQRDNLPRDVKEARQAITDGLQALVKEGVITSRSDVLQSLTDAGFEIARQTDKAISIKNPDPESKRNIRLTGGLYERDFNFSREVQNTVETASNEYRAGATERYNAAKQLYDSEIERKRDYHQGRHGQPTAKHQAVTDNVVRTENRYRYSPYDIFRAAPTPFVQRFTTARRRHADDDRRLRNRYNDVDTATRGQASQNYQVRDESMGNLGFLDYIRSLDTRHHARSVNSKQSQGADLHLQAVERPSAAISPTVPTAEVRVNYGQEIARTSTESTTGAGRHDTATAADARRQRPRYSRIDSIIDQASTSSNTASRALAELIRTITEQDKRTDDRTKQLDESSQELLREHEGLSSRVNDVMQRSNSASREHERVSECSSATREFKREYRAVEGKIEQFAENAERTRDLTNKNNQLADRNTDGVDGIKQIADQAREVIKTQENQRQQRYSAPRMGM
jgi:hypothetical protein